MADSKKHNFILRTISTVLLIPVVSYILYENGLGARILFWLSSAIAIFEWGKLCFRVQFALVRKLKWLLTGYVFIIFSLLGLWYVLKIQGSIALLQILMLVWASDIGAYLLGSTLRGPKLIPSISPNKTWSGSIGGLIICTFVSFLQNLYYTDRHGEYLHMSGESLLINTLFFGVVISLLTQCGDLIESWSKRQMNIKDSGRLIPGHGGILDRVDGLLAVGFVLGIVWLYNILQSLL